MTPKAVIYSLVMVSSMIAVGLYHSRLRDGMAGMLLRVVISLLIGIAILSMFVYIVLEYFFGRGVLGLAQLCYPYGARIDDARKKLEYELHYVKNQSLLMDTLILLRTTEVIVWRKGGR